MFCMMCGSDHQLRAPAEINIHMPGLKHLDNPGVLVFPNLLVCLECGYSGFSTPQPELARLAEAEAA